MEKRDSRESSVDEAVAVMEKDLRMGSGSRQVAVVELWQ